MYYGVRQIDIKTYTEKNKHLKIVRKTLKNFTWGTY